MSAGPAVYDLQAVQTRRSGRAEPEAPVVTLTARIALPVGDVRVTVRPLMAVLADDSGSVPRVEFHVDGGSSVVLEGPPLAALLQDSIAFLKDAKAGAERAHDHVYGLVATFDVAMSPFVTLEQPPFIVAEARTFLHPTGAVALRLLGERRPRTLGPEHAPPRPGEPAEREAFSVQLQSRRGAWLAKALDDAVRGLGDGSSPGDSEDSVRN